MFVFGVNFRNGSKGTAGARCVRRGAARLVVNHASLFPSMLRFHSLAQISSSFTPFYMSTPPPPHTPTGLIKYLYVILDRFALVCLGVCVDLAEPSTSSGARNAFCFPYSPPLIRAKVLDRAITSLSHLDLFSWEIHYGTVPRNWSGAN